MCHVEVEENDFECRSSRLHLPRAGVTGIHEQVWCSGVLGFDSRVLCKPDKNSTNEAITPNPASHFSGSEEFSQCSELHSFQWYHTENGRGTLWRTPSFLLKKHSNLEGPFRSHFQFFLYTCYSSTHMTRTHPPPTPATSDFLSRGATIYTTECNN